MANRYVVHCIDHQRATELRQKNYEAHKAYLATAEVRTVISGPLLADDGETMIGSMFVVEADAKAIVETFNRQDPFNRAGVWAEVRIHPFSMRVDNRGQNQ